MRLWFQKHAAEGRLPHLDAWYREHFARVARPDTELHVGTLPPAAYHEELPDDMVGYGQLALYFSGHFAQTAVTAQTEGYDAWIIGAGQDPGLREARALTGIPVVGYGETAFFHAAMQGARFGLLGFIPELREIIGENIRRMGLGSLLAAHEVIPDGQRVVTGALADTADGIAEFREHYTAAAQRAVAAGAQLLIPAEGIPNEILVHHQITELADTPVIDPGGLAIKTAEALVELAALHIIGRPRTGYWFRQAPPVVAKHIAHVFAGDPPIGRRS